MADPAGLSIELFGASAACHDYHAGEQGAFERRCAELSRVGRARRSCVVVTPITRANYRVLGEMPALLRHNRVHTWRLTVPPMTEPVVLVPRLAMALPFALHAVDRATKFGVQASIDGAPLCLLGPYADRARFEGPRSYPEPCQACRLRSDCSGIDSGYVDRFGDGELKPRE